MQDELNYPSEIRWYRKVDRTYVGLRMSLPGIFGNLNQPKWNRYLAECRQSLHRVAAQNRLSSWCGPSTSTATTK